MGKRITEEQLLGQRGVNLIERILLEMGFAWNPTTAATDAGIDGYIELRDPTTGEMSATVLLVQSKARSYLENETPDSFDFTPKQADLDYWRQSNAPLLLIVSRPSTQEAWWKEIRGYCRSRPSSTRKITFHKIADRFDTRAAPLLLQEARQARPGLYFAPPRIRETLTTNLITITRLPPRLFMAETPYHDGRAMSRAMAKLGGHPPREWIVRDKMLYSVHDLREGRWPELCDRGTVEEIETSEWAESDDQDTLNKFVELLEYCLRELLSQHDIRYRRSLQCYYVAATPNLSKRVFAYRSREKHTERDVFVRLTNKTDPTKHYYRHSAFESRFRRIDGRWYLEIEPGYVFTVDGMLEHPRQAERLSALRRVEGHAAVFGQVLMFARVLEERPDSVHGRYEFLALGPLATVDVDCGILDEVWSGTGWTSSEETRQDGDVEPEEPEGDDNDGQLSLF